MATIKLPGRSILDMDNRKIEGLPAATVNGDAVRYEQLLTAPELFLTGDTITYNINSAGTLTIGFKTNGDLIAFINEAQLPLSQGNGELTQTYTGNFIFTINGTTYTVSPSGGTTFNWVYNTDSGTILQFTGAVSLPVPPLNTVQPNDPLFVEGVLSTVIGRFPVSTLIPGTGLTFEVEEGLLRIDALAELGIAGATLPVTDLTDGRIFYLESHSGDDDAGWYVYRTATTGIPAGWHFAGVHYEAADIYPEIGADAGSTDHVEPFNLTAGFWLHNGQVWLYTSAGDISINSATDLYNNGPVAGDGTRRGGWQLWTEFVASKQDALPNLHYGGVWTNGGTTANPVYASETIDIIGIIGDQHVDHTFANIGAWQADTTTNFEVGQYVALTSSSTARYKITTQSTGYSATGFTEFAVGDEDVENLILATASDISRAGGRFPTTEAWQNNRFALKGESGGGVDVEETFPTNAALGHQIFLDPAGNNVTVVDDDGHRRPRGFYSYIQPLSNPNSRYWEQITIPEVPELYNSAREGDLIYLTDAEEDFNGVGNNFDAGFYRAGPTSANAQTWIATGGTTGNSVEVNGIRVHNANFSSHTEAATYLYSPPFQSDENTTTGDTDVSVQVDTREIGNALGINSLKAQVHQIEEELSQSGSYTWVDEQVFVDVFITNRVNSSGTLNQATILQPHFVDNSNIFTTYALLTGDDDTGLRNQWNGFNSNAAGIIVGLGPDDTDLVAFQLLSTYYRDSTAAGLAEIRLKMIDPDGDFAGPSRVGTNTNKQQFISWISDNDNPITTEDPNPVIHQGISTYYYETDNDFLDTVRHNVGSHIEGSALTADERVIVDNFAGITMPGGDNVITLGQYDSGGGGIETKGDWYWRNAQSGPAQVTFSSTPVWSDLVNTSAANPAELHILMLEAATVDAAKLEAIRATIGTKRNNGDTSAFTDAQLGLLYVAHDNSNWAILEVASSPSDTANNDVRFWINRVVESQGAPKTASSNPNTLSITISDVGTTVGAYVGDLTVDGDLEVTGAINDGNSTAMAYVAIQFTSIFTEIRTSILDGGLTSPDVPANYTYIEYTAEFGGTRVTMIDRVASTGATITRRFTTATPADFNTGTVVEQS